MQFVPGYQNVDNNMFNDVSSPPLHNNLPSSSWLHVPPMHMPWGTPLASQPSIVRFTAESSPVLQPMLKPSEQFRVNAFQCKRKIDADAEIHAVKKHITEEKMAAHMSQLSISGDYSPVSDSATIVSEDPEPGTSGGRRLILSEELRNLQSEPILPQSLISKMEKPSMALVLWQPPAGRLGDQLRSAARLNATVIRNDEEERQRRQQQQHQQPPLESADNNNTPTAVDLNAFNQPQGDAFTDGSLEMEL